VHSPCALIFAACIVSACSGSFTGKKIKVLTH
jgi:hypothetical protein